MSDKDTEDRSVIGSPQRTSQRKGKGTDSRVHFKDDIALQQQRARTPNKQGNTDNENLNNIGSDTDSGMVNSVVALEVHQGMEGRNNERNDNGNPQPNLTDTPPPHINFTPHDDHEIYAKLDQFQLMDNIKSAWNNKKPADIQAIKQYMKL